MAKRLDAKALKGAFARGKTKRNLDFLVPEKDAAPERAAEAPAPPPELSQSGPQRRKQAAGKRTTAKRTAAKRKVTQRATKQPAAKPKQPAATPRQPAATHEQPVPKPSEPQELGPEQAPAEAVAPVAVAAPGPRTVAAPDAQGTRVVHDASPAELQALEAELTLHALYDGWAPTAPPARLGLLRRLRARLRRACEGLLGAAVNGVLSQPAR
ncbi:MAG: hypothetical protein KDD82_31395 [Planctomycetes bacterium]|nr:hypothetical protein [Planctomycetota bacterium]